MTPRSKSRTSSASWGLGKELTQAILDAAQQIAVPAFVSTICICIVFVPMFFLSGVPRYLFVPLAEAVVFALLASYFFSRTIIPTSVMFLMRKEIARKPRIASRQHETGRFGRLHQRFEHAFERFQARYSRLLQLCIERRILFVTCFAIFLSRYLGTRTESGKRLLSGSGRGSIQAACPRQNRHSHRGNRP